MSATSILLEKIMLKPHETELSAEIDKYESEHEFAPGKKSRQIDCKSQKEAYRWAEVWKGNSSTRGFKYDKNGVLTLYGEEEDFSYFFLYGESAYENIWGEPPTIRF